MTRQQRIENNYFIRLGRQISGDPYLEPQLAMQLGRDRFAGFRGMPSTRPEQFNTLSGNIASVSEDPIMGDDSIENFSGQGPYFDAESAMNEFADADPLDTTTPNELAFLNDEKLPSGLTRNELASRVGNMDMSGKSMAPQTMFDDELATGELALNMGYGGESVPMEMDPIQDFAMSPQRPEFNPMTGKVEATPVMPMGRDFEMDMASTPSLTPMADETKGWFDSLKSNFSSNTDAYSDPFLLGGMAIGARDQSPVFPNTPFKGSGSGIAKGALTGAGLGAKTGTPQGALIGAGIGAVAGLLGNFDSQSVEYTPAPKIIRGSGIPFPQASSMDYYKGLI